MTKKNVLIVCRKYDELSWLEKYQPHDSSRYFLVSDDIMVQTKAKSFNWINQIDFIEKIESLFNVAEDVIVIQKKISNWLKTLSNKHNGFPRELFYFPRHVDGGMTTQRIQDSLLLIRSYLFLLKKFSIDEVILIRNSAYFWEDSIFIQTAKSLDTRITEIPDNKALSILKRLKVYLKALAYDLFYFFVFLRIKIRPNGNSRDKSKDEIVFQLCSSAEKHIDNIIPVMKELGRKKFKTKAICWSAPGASEKIIENGVEAVDLESYLTFNDWVDSLFRFTWTVRQALRRKKNFVEDLDLTFQTVDLGLFLWPSILYFLFADLRQSYRLKLASARYLKVHQPIAVQLWGSISLRQGFVFWKNTKKISPPMFFTAQVGNFIEDPYFFPDDHPEDLWFTFGKTHRNFMVDTIGIPPNKIEITGQPRYQDLKDFKNRFSQNDSASILKIPKEFNRYILFDFNEFVRGYISVQEQMTVLMGLIRFVQKHKEVALIIKPHPNAKLKSLSEILRIYKAQNIILIDKSMLPYHAINSANIVITAFSTIGIEAMILEKPVLSVNFENEKRWKVFDDAVDYFDNVQDLLTLLEKIVTESEFYEFWQISQIERQNKFLKSYFEGVENDSPTLSANAIEKHLSLYTKKKTSRNEKQLIYSTTF